MSVLVALLLAAAAAEPTYSKVALVGWTGDGKSVVYEAMIYGESLEAGEPDGRLVFLVVAGADGAVQRVFRQERSSRNEDAGWKAGKEGEAFWGRAEPEKAGESWRAGQKLSEPGEERALEGKLEEKDLAARVELGKKGCAPLTLLVRMGAAEAPLVVDECARGEKARPEQRSRIQIAWSPDRARAALAWNVVRIAPGEDEVPRGHFAVASRKALASVDLLDAGAGAGADKLALALAGAGFRVAHRGKAAAARPATLVFFAPGFEAEAREIATVIGAAADAVQPLSWKSPYAITIAAAPR